jgi:hypothetical protein
VEAGPAAASPSLSGTDSESKAVSRGSGPGAEDGGSVWESNPSVKSLGNAISRNPRGAQSGALGTQDPLTDPDLDAIVAAWPTLPEAIRAGIVAMVKAAVP